jgi:hypothetical protein
MRRLLRPHPDFPCPAVSSIEVDVVRPHAGSLVLRFIVTGGTGDLCLPPVTTTAPGDELWLHTCFEVFIRAAADNPYCEFNFAPSTRWAAYRFDNYRVGRSIADEISAPRIEVQSNAGCYTLKAALELDGMPGLPSDAMWRLGLAAVIEDKDNRLSYWALAHPPGKADFHHPDCFAHELPPA